MKTMRAIKMIALLPVIFVATYCPSAAHGNFITDLSVNISPEASGRYRYEYTLTNDPTSDRSVTSFTLDVASDADLQAVSGPVDWLVTYDPGNTFVLWESPDALFDLAPSATT